MSSVDPAEHQWNCLNCKRRKVRCDRHYPCANCVKGLRECVFPTSGRVFRRPEPQRDLARPKAKQAELMDRIRRLEKVVVSLNTELESRPAPSSEGTPAPSSSQGMTGDSANSEADGFAASPLHLDSRPRDDSISSFSPPSGLGLTPPQSQQQQATPSDEKGSIYVGDHFWAALRREIRIIRETFDELAPEDTDNDSTYESNLLPPAKSTFAVNPCFVFGNSKGDGAESNMENLDKLRPLPAEMFFIWQTFVDLVSPFVHILHVPTVGKAIHGCRGRIDALDSSMQPLMFAISMAAVNSLTVEEVRDAFNRDKGDFLAQLRLGTEKALGQADLLNTTSLPVVQAFILYLFTLRRCESARYIWCLVGLLVRIAVSIGLHRDGSHFPNLSPFEVEIRRRIWWHICCTEVRLGDGQVPEMGISERNFDTLDPTNVDDADIEPGMKNPPVPRQGFTDTTITLIACEKWRLTRTMQSVTSKLSSGQGQGDSEANIQEKLEKLHSFKDRISAERWHWQLDQPIQLALSMLSKVHCNSWELMILHHKRQSSFQEDRPDEKSFTLALAIIEDFFEFQTNEATQRWAWLVQGNVYWQPLAIVLARICSCPWDSTSEHAWSLVTRSLEIVPDIVHTDPLWRTLQQLVTRANRHRMQQLESQTQSHQQSVAEPQMEQDKMQIAESTRSAYEEQQATVEESANTAGPSVALSQLDGLSLQGLPATSTDAMAHKGLPGQDLPLWFSNGDLDQSYGDVGQMDVDNFVQSMDWGEWSEAFPI
ncbi:hypothetical protein PFICI_06053 [Pestalotiopsis fici W106-1]|uniref:Zn(2)-C6 fungal-type domain-containing protein n=1 Tax=Pestalotiopsis fici (strain W106-1 / CGMCC3.15140) TaxID=1229662 RepID=W3X795_PESFW|nr:uncharacterized protein PFICI_06053 [Pestalotiopsis fici W106-1]ETS81051.1 hypothetical protein PFICI_06053 [Pestalotiopsis fici W106-1]